MFISASLFSLIEKLCGDAGELIAYIGYDIIIVVACYFICKENPKSIWYVPVIANAMGIVTAIVEPNFWITPLWMLFSSGWVLSLMAAIYGAFLGRRAIQPVKPE